MRNLNRCLVVSMLCIMAVIVAMQVPLSGLHTGYLPMKGFVQPDSTDFSGWIKNPGQIQINDENSHGLGLIPSPVDLSIVSQGLPLTPTHSKIPLLQYGKRHFTIIAY
jgi:hypothetical protein